VVKQVVKSLKMTSTKDNTGDWDLTWTDGAVSAEMLTRMKIYQKINHFPGMFQLSRKNYLARNIAKMHKKYP
jgi:tubulin polyglutamylase TTLL6/13